MNTNKEIQAATNDIMETLVNADNQATDSPYWLIIDPITLERNKDPGISNIANCISGPFFSKEDAYAFLKATHYNFSDKANVYCHSGWKSQKYKAFCRSLRIGYSEPIKKDKE